MIAIGIFLAIVEFFKEFRKSKEQSFTSVRLVLASYLALALEFQLAADILATAIGPSWDQLGRLAAIAVIRTALNYFLSREIRESEEKLESEKDSETQ